MVQEIEAKILEVDPRNLEARLAALGARKVFEGDVESFFFDFQDHRLRRKGHTLRLRRMGDTVRLTLKGVIRKEGAAKLREEYEVKLDDLEAGKLLLQGLGLEEIGNSGKRRSSFCLERPGASTVSFEIDTLPGVPPFLEIEAENLEIIKEMARKLEFREIDLRPWTETQVKLYYRKIEQAREALKRLKKN